MNFRGLGSEDETMDDGANPFLSLYVEVAVYVGICCFVNILIPILIYFYLMAKDRQLPQEKRYMDKDKQRLFICVGFVSTCVGSIVACYIARAEIEARKREVELANQRLPLDIKEGLATSV